MPYGTAELEELYLLLASEESSSEEIAETVNAILPGFSVQVTGETYGKKLLKIVDKDLYDAFIFVYYEMDYYDEPITMDDGETVIKDRSLQSFLDYCYYKDLTL